VSDSWPVRIQNVILEKADNKGNIFHMAVDRCSREGCVYIKCASADDGGLRDAGSCHVAMFVCLGRTWDDKSPHLENYLKRQTVAQVMFFSYSYFS
jgi:hypothetical protein